MPAEAAAAAAAEVGAEGCQQQQQQQQQQRCLTVTLQLACVEISSVCSGLPIACAQASDQKEPEDIRVQGGESNGSCS